jgi:hypothetical protein
MKVKDIEEIPKKTVVGVIDIDDTSEEETSPYHLNRYVADQVDYTQFTDPAFGRQLVYFEMLYAPTATTDPFEKLGWKTQSLYDGHVFGNDNDVPRHEWDLTYTDIGTVPDFVWSWPPSLHKRSTSISQETIMHRVASFIKWCLKKHPHFTILFQNRDETLDAVKPLMKGLSEVLNLHTTCINYTPQKERKNSTQVWSNVSFPNLTQISDFTPT